MPFVDLLLGIVFWLVVVFACAIFFVEVILRLVRRYVHFPAPAFMVFLLNNPLRRRFQPPEKVVDWAGIKGGMQVLELGPGGGTFTFEAAKRVGPEGHVYAVDIEPRVTAKLGGMVKERKAGNITVKTASAYEIPLLDGSLDLVFMIAVLAEVPDRQRALREFKRVLKLEGTLAIGELLFDPDYPRKRTVVRWCEEAGFKLERSYGALWYYVLTFTSRP
jgi:ubiquinone/menaquinone biosynthesis C-methylase UbiE